MNPFILFLMVGGTGLNIIGQSKAAKAQQEEIGRQAQQEKLAGQTQELTRRERLNKILAANVASAAGMGVPLEGSMQSVSLQSAKKASISEGAETLSDRLRQDILKRKSRAVGAASSAETTATLLNAGIQGYQLSK